MPRSIWNGVISFGMVSIPVKLFTGTQDKDISFHLIHKEDNARIKMRRWCPLDEKFVEMDEIVRGYEYSREQYVILTEEDFEKLPLPSKHTIELSAFVDAEEIDPVFYEKSYYLEPDEAATKPYALLMRALKEKGLTAVAKIAIRNKERLCALRPMDGVLVLETLYYPDEIRIEKETGVPEVDVSKRELDMAFTLIDLLHEPFEPDKYKDQYREALMQVIEAKLEGEELAEVTAPAPARVTDLMSALKASVEAAKKRREEDEGDREEAPRRRRARAAAG
ncbi:MAG: Ku protein [Chloroflexi bacterium]|nr:MAG: Ku protein [Chloroflexota bacterium]